VIGLIFHYAQSEMTSSVGAASNIGGTLTIL
jgi:hypothetical protein